MKCTPIMISFVTATSPQTHIYIFLLNCHPKHCTTSIPYSQAINTKQICFTNYTVTKRFKSISPEKTGLQMKKTLMSFFLVLTPSVEINFYGIKKKVNLKESRQSTFDHTIEGRSHSTDYNHH